MRRSADMSVRIYSKVDWTCISQYATGVLMF